ncbi:MAG: response receiver sensor histidine kinase response regulator [Fibrobacteres bacterium]|nr:response receiver sensor histidine kinase response regulator [Fibrobacterota bacterium]
MHPMATGTIRALIIDDNPDDRTLVMRALRREFPDLEAAEASDAEAFRNALEKARFDVVITDYQLNWSTGLELLPAIKDIQPLCPIIMFTDSGSEQIAVDALKQGVDDYILKSPRQFRRLATSVRSSLEKTRLRRRADSLDRKLNDLLAELEVGVYRVTTRGHLIYGNPAFYRMLRLASKPGATARRIRNLILNPDDQAWIFRTMKQSGRVHIPELPLRRADGTILWVSLTQVLRPSKTLGGTIDGIVEDITEKKRLDSALRSKEAELRQAQQLESIGKLAGGVAHDFNNMLSAILGYSELLLEADPKMPPNRESLKEIHKAAKRAACLTRELLAFGRKQMLFPKVVDINGIVTKMESLIRRTLGDRADLDLAIGNGPVRIKVDPVQLEIVIMNLVNNAHDAMPEGGRLTIRTGIPGREEAGFPLLGTQEGDFPDRPSPSKPFACLIISDTGFGMSREVQSRIFEPYFTTKNEFHNSGLGLSTVYGIVNQSGGYILVDSQPGRGASFKLFFPSAQVPEAERDERMVSDVRNLN